MPARPLQKQTESSSKVCGNKPIKLALRAVLSADCASLRDGSSFWEALRLAKFSEGGGHGILPFALTALVCFYDARFS